MLYNAAVESDIEENSESAKPVKHDRAAAKAIVMDLLTESEIKKLFECDDDEEETIWTSKDETDEIDLAKYVTLVDHLTELKASVKHQLSLDKDNETMLTFVHSATWIRADNFGIDHAHVNIEMTHFACGKIIPALSTTTGIIVGFLMNELLKLKLDINWLDTESPNVKQKLQSRELLSEFNINLAVPSISSSTLSNILFKQRNSYLNRVNDFKVWTVESLNQNSSYTLTSLNPDNRYYTSWYKHVLPDDIPGFDISSSPKDYKVTIRDVVEFTKMAYNIDPIAIQLYPNFLLLRYTRDNERFEMPLINEFKGIVKKSQKYCIIYVIADEQTDGKYVVLPPFKIMINRP